MNLDDQKITGLGSIHITDSLELPLLKIVIKRNSNTVVPESSNSIDVYVDKNTSTNPSADRKHFVFDLLKPLAYLNQVSDELIVEVKPTKNDVKLVSYVKRKIGNGAILSTITEETVDGSLISLFEGENYIYTNYTNADIEVIYPKNNDLNKAYLNNATYCMRRLNGGEDFSLDDIYFKDAFTKTEDKLNLEVDNATIKCLSSKNNKFSLDENGNLIVNSITTNETSQLVIDNATICNLIYPVGSIYLSINSTNPATLFGGTWQQLKDKFLLGAGDIYSSGTSGGSANHNHTVPGHTHTSPAHNHNIDDCVALINTFNKYVEIKGKTYYWYSEERAVGASYEGSGRSNNWAVQTRGDTSTTTPGNTGSTELTTNSSSNLPPYMTVYMWKRTA